MIKDIILEIEVLKVFLLEGLDYLVLVEMLGFVVDWLMVFDVDQFCGVGKYECSVEWFNYWNGYWLCIWEMCVGCVDLKILKLCKGLYFLEFLEFWCVVEKVMVVVIQEVYVQGFLI